MSRKEDIAEVRKLTSEIREMLKDEPADQFVHTAYELCNVLENAVNAEDADLKPVPSSVPVQRDNAEVEK